MSEEKSLHLRGLIEREGDVYVAHCIELGIAVQGDSVEEVKRHMDEAVDSYLQRVSEIYAEGDHAGAMALLQRKAPLSIRAKYLWAWLKTKCRTPKPPRDRVWETDHRPPFAFS